MAGIYLCETCADSLYQIFNDLPGLLEDLEITTAKLDNTGTKGGTSHSGPVLPVNLGALETKMHLEIIITSWSSMLNDYANTRQKREPQQPHLAYLRGNINTIRSFDFAGDMHEELKDAYRDALRLVDLPRDIRILGTCSEPNCSGKIRADGNADTATCSECRSTYSTTDLEAWNRERTRGEPMRAGAVRKYLKKHAGVTITQKDLDNWVARKQLWSALERITTGTRTQRIYYPGDVLKAHQKMSA